MAVSAIELSGEVQIIFMIPPSRKPITSGDCSAAAVMVPPMTPSTELTAGSTAKAIRRETGAMISAPGNQVKAGRQVFFNVRSDQANDVAGDEARAGCRSRRRPDPLQPRRQGLRPCRSEPDARCHAAQAPAVEPTSARKAIPSRSPVIYL